MLAQQVAANFLQYGVQYVTPYQTATNAAVNYFLGTGGGDFVPLLQSAAADAVSGNISLAFTELQSALWTAPAVQIGEPLEGIPTILNPITQNLANTSKYLTTTGLKDFGGWFALTLATRIFTPIGTGLQNVYDSLIAGDPVGALINTIDIPGELTNSIINGFPSLNGTYSSGILSDGTNGLAKIVLLTLPQGLATQVVAPNAQNIMSGGSLSYALGYLANLVTTGFPNPQTVVDNAVNLLQYLFANPGAAAAAVNVGNFAALAPAASALPGLSVGVVKAFDPAAVTNIAASLGPSLAAEVAGSLGSSLGANLAGSLATTLSVDLSKIALHILSAL
ncbi:hypothetical protein H7H82_15600 [Mycobacterium heidelbergense]|uniref:glycoside hydrolase family 43 protein n=1 Tax=Mycobacterium heidelbergense TaxID=53376 RepID=UPI00115343A6|nr:glycoside hydrolase family 43 protein [Mycobacterium heidelbergense]MCV7052001.1 hypothetical protein [Mycobacterium heidelbergense]